MKIEDVERIGAKPSNGKGLEDATGITSELPRLVEH